VKNLGIVLVVLLALLAGGVGYLFWAQNAGTEVDLVLRLPFVGGWYLARGAPLPLLLGAAALAGFVVAGLWFTARGLVGARRLRTTQRQVKALQDELDFHKRTAGRPVGSPVPRPAPVPAQAPSAAASAPAGPLPAPAAGGPTPASAASAPSGPPPSSPPPSSASSSPAPSDYDDIV
jgi:hypothetical protein